MDTLQAALLRVKLPYNAQYATARRSNAHFYNEALSQLPGVVIANPQHCQCFDQQMSHISQADVSIILPCQYEHNTHVWNQYTIRVLGNGKRDALKAFLLDRKIGCEIYYPVTMDQQECFADTSEFSRNCCEVAHQLATEVLSIPIYGELNNEQLQTVVAAINDFLHLSGA
jgi:dTDP-4-amino-4,6-dideoxygalactose transaminase